MYLKKQSLILIFILSFFPHILIAQNATFNKEIILYTNFLRTPEIKINYTKSNHTFLKKSKSHTVGTFTNQNYCMNNCTFNKETNYTNYKKQTQNQENYQYASFTYNKKNKIQHTIKNSQQIQFVGLDTGEEDPDNRPFEAPLNSSFLFLFILINIYLVIKFFNQSLNSLKK